MARNKLKDLNNHLFAQLERLSEEDLEPEEIQKESQRAKAISSIATNIIKNAKISLEAMKLVSDGVFEKEQIPEVLGINEKREQQ